MSEDFNSIRDIILHQSTQINQQNKPIERETIDYIQ